MITVLDYELEKVCKIANEIYIEYLESHKDTCVEKYMYEIAAYCSKLLGR